MNGPGPLLQFAAAFVVGYVTTRTASWPQVLAIAAGLVVLLAVGSIASRVVFPDRPTHHHDKERPWSS